MHPHDDLEAELALRLARKRWGTGFDGRPLCPDCQDRTMWRRRDRLRVFGCSGCRREHSVTAGTWMHSAKLTLAAIQSYVEVHRAPFPPSARTMAQQTGHAVSTAWSWCLRIKSAIGALKPTLHARPFAIFARIRVRRPHGASPPPHPEAHPANLAACKDRRFVSIAFLSDGLGHTAFMPACTQEEVGLALARNGALLVWRLAEDANRRLLDHGRHLVHEVHRTVSERWLPRYLAFAQNQPNTPDPWDAMVKRAPLGFPRLRPAALPAHRLDDLFRPTHATSKALEKVCEALRLRRPLSALLRATRARHPRVHHTAAPGRFQRTRRG
jgi:hypothetical protein